jgi:WD40 repeat protein
VGGIVRRCLEKAKEGRYASGHDVAMVLEAVLAAPSGAAALREVEERSPYPGLSSFTEKDAAVFFGREHEVDEIWKRIHSRKLLAVIGPSGAGKTSFVRAGVVARRPEGWKALVATPGAQAFRGLSRVLAPELAGDPEALTRLADIEDPDVALELLVRWRRGTAEALLVMDQFEELLTLNPLETQERFVALLSRLTAEADVHVLLSLRDDFLIRACEHEALAPVLEGLTALLALKPDDLRRAIEEPAKKQGYRFEDEALVEEMVQAVEGARAALPLLSFAVSRLWEKRDRERKVLTRAAYEEIGGVAGALAQHAEQTLDRIGAARQDMVREIFRNLVTAQGTRAVADREELLSVFPERGAAEEVLGQLIDSRLLTSYEVEDSHSERLGEEDGAKNLERAATTHRIEIVHESLLTAWPRLVWWQSQDEEGAHLRDQLKQAAHLWEERQRSPDLLWTGSAYQEFEVWRRRYPGQLTALEDAFAEAMAQRSLRRRRLRRGAVAAAFAGVLAIAAGVTVSRHQIALSRDQARTEARRAEAAQLLALAEHRLDEDPTEALALTTASLELDDTRQARVFALRVLSEAPPAIETRSLFVRRPTFSPDGRWLAVAGFGAVVQVWPEDGGEPIELGGHDSSPQGGNEAWWTASGLLVTGLSNVAREVHVWALPEGRELRTIAFGAPTWWQVGLRYLLAGTREGDGLLLRRWVLPDGAAEVLGHLGGARPGGDSEWAGASATSSLFDPSGTSWLFSRGRTIFAQGLPLGDPPGPPSVVTRHVSDAVLAPFRGHSLLYSEDSGEIRIWSAGPKLDRAIRKPDSAEEWLVPSAGGSWLAGGRPQDDRKLRVWSPRAWREARPLELRRSGSWYAANFDIDPRGEWIAASTNSQSRVTFWPLGKARAWVVDGYAGLSRPLAFSPDSRWLATSWPASFSDTLRLWPVPGGEDRAPRSLTLPEAVLLRDLVFDPQGRYLFAVGNADRAYVVPLDGSPPRGFPVYSEDTLLDSGAVSPSGRFVATGFTYGKGERTLRVWDLEADRVRLYDIPRPEPGAEGAADDSEGRTGYEQDVRALGFADDATLYTSGQGGIRRWNLTTGEHELVIHKDATVWTWGMELLDGGTKALTLDVRFGKDARWHGPVELHDLRAGTSRTLEAFGTSIRGVHPIATSGPFAVAGDAEGTLRVARVSDGEPHLLLGHAGAVTDVAMSPDGRWIASAGGDNTLRLWPMPDLEQPPLHTQPHDELLAKLKSLTNLHAVRSPDDPTGWAIELGPFPGWKEVPEW